MTDRHAAHVDGIREAQFEVQYTPFLVGLAEVVAMSGRVDEALALADEAMQRTERNNVFWCMPETLRIRGEIMLLNKDVCCGEGTIPPFFGLSTATKRVILGASYCDEPW